MTEQEAHVLARTLVKTTEDRRGVYLESRAGRLDLERQPTLEGAKAQWSDAVWFLEQLFLGGAK